MSLGDILLKRVKVRLDSTVKAFADGLVDDELHPKITGITRGNWVPSVNAPTLSQLYYGFTQSDIYDAMSVGAELVSIGEASHTASNFTWQLGDKIYWTNSLDHIGELEHRRMFFDAVVNNATYKAQKAAWGSRR